MGVIGFLPIESDHLTFGTCLAIPINESGSVLGAVVPAEANEFSLRPSPRVDSPPQGGISDYSRA